MFRRVDRFKAIWWVALMLRVGVTKEDIKVKIGWRYRIVLCRIVQCRLEIITKNILVMIKNILYLLGKISLSNIHSMQKSLVTNNCRLMLLQLMNNSSCSGRNSRIGQIAIQLFNPSNSNYLVKVRLVKSFMIAKMVGMTLRQVYQIRK